MAENQFTMTCPNCGLSIAAPMTWGQEKPEWDPRLEAWRIRIHVGPNDVEYQTHVDACAMFTGVGDAS